MNNLHDFIRENEDKLEQVRSFAKKMEGGLTVEGSLNLLDIIDPLPLTRLKNES